MGSRFSYKQNRIEKGSVRNRLDPGLNGVKRHQGKIRVLAAGRPERIRSKIQIFQEATSFYIYEKRILDNRSVHNGQYPFPVRSVPFPIGPSTPKPANRIKNASPRMPCKNQFLNLPRTGGISVNCFRLPLERFAHHSQFRPLDLMLAQELILYSSTTGKHNFPY